MSRRSAAVLVAAVSLLGLVAVPTGSADGPWIPEAATPELSIPPSGIRRHALFDAWWDISQHPEIPYTEQEYFVSGTAIDGAGASAEYTTRIIVFRPQDVTDFNGSVLLDWTNVTAQFENAVDSVSAYEYLMREGWAFVHVSAQSAGVCCSPLTPKVWDPVRYADLDHPGDAFSFDIFRQVAKAMKQPAHIDPLAGYAGERIVVAAGQSQSGGRLTSYVNGPSVTDENGTTVYSSPGWDVHGEIDGFIIHGSNSLKKFNTSFGPMDNPVLHLLSDNEAHPADGPDDPNYALWEVAGTAHSDFWIGYHSEVGSSGRVVASEPKRPREFAEEVARVAGNYGEQPHPMMATCVLAGATFPMHYAASAALDHMDNWIRAGSGAAYTVPEGARYSFVGTLLVRDADSNAVGGIRLAPIDVPVASYRSTACPLGGITVPFTDAELLERYGSHQAYLAELLPLIDQNVAEGFLLPEDAADLRARAQAAANRWPADAVVGAAG